MDKELLNQLIDNHVKDTTKCQKTIGGLEQLYALADFHERYARELQLIGANAMLDFVGTSFNEDKLAGFQQGLAIFPEFLKQCYLERQAIELKAATRSEKAQSE